MLSEKDLVGKALDGDEDARDLLYKRTVGTIQAVLLPKICKMSWQGTPLPEGLAELCEGAFEKALGLASEKRVGMGGEGIDWFKHCQYEAVEFWNEMARRANGGEQVAIDRLFLLCRKPLIGYLSAKFGAHSGLAEDYYNWTYVRLRERIYDCPYDPVKYSLYSYLKYIGNIVNMEKRKSAGNGIGLPFKGTKGIYTDPREIHLTNGLSDSDSKTGEEPLSRLPNHTNPEGLMLVKEEVNQRKRSIKAKLFTIRLCAEYSKPHQFLAFGFNKWLRWKTEMVVEKCSDIELGKLFIELLKNTLSDLGFLIHEKDLKECFSPLPEKLAELTRRIYKEGDYEKLVEENGDLKVGKLTFRAFDSYNENPEKSISDWTDKVKKAMWNALSLLDYTERKRPKREHAKGKRARKVNSKRI